MGFPKERGGSHVPESPFPPRTLPEADLPASLHTRSTPGHIAPLWAPSPWELHPLNSAKLRADSGFPPVQGFPCSCCEAEPQSCTALSHLLPARSEASEPCGQKIKKICGCQGNLHLFLVLSVHQKPSVSRAAFVLSVMWEYHLPNALSPGQQDCSGSHVLPSSSRVSPISACPCCAIAPALWPSQHPHTPGTQPHEMLHRGSQG